MEENPHHLNSRFIVSSPFLAREEVIPIIGQLCTGRSWILCQYSHIREFFMLLSLLPFSLSSVLLFIFPFFPSSFPSFLLCSWRSLQKTDRGRCHVLSDSVYLHFQEISFLPSFICPWYVSALSQQEAAMGFINLGFLPFTGFSTLSQTYALSASTLHGQVTGKGHTERSHRIVNKSNCSFVCPIDAKFRHEERRSALKTSSPYHQRTQPLHLVFIDNSVIWGKREPLEACVFFSAMDIGVIIFPLTT